MQFRVDEKCSALVLILRKAGSGGKCYLTLSRTGLSPSFHDPPVPCTHWGPPVVKLTMGPHGPKDGTAGANANEKGPFVTTLHQQKELLWRLNLVCKKDMAIYNPK